MKIRGWHFLRSDNKLRDGRDAPPDGVTLQQDGSIIPCESGLHASVRAVHALCYRPEPVRAPICRVELSGTIVPDGDLVDKHAASERTILWRLDGETTDRVLYEFARWSALQVVDLWDAPDVMRQYLQTGDESLRAAARAAARDAQSTTREAVWYAASAAWFVAQRAVSYVAVYAAEAIARSDTWYTTKDDTWYAIRDAAINTQNDQLEHLVIEAHEAA